MSDDLISCGCHFYGYFCAVSVYRFFLISILDRYPGILSVFPGDRHGIPFSLTSCAAQG